MEVRAKSDKLTSGPPIIMANDFYTELHEQIVSGKILVDTGMGTEVIVGAHKVGESIVFVTEYADSKRYKKDKKLGDAKMIRP